MADTTKHAILIVDDEETIHRALERTLRREPYELLHAFDAAEADAILSQHPEIAAVVCDHSMPGMPGLEFLTLLRRRKPRLVAILLTAQADLQMVITAMNEGRLHRFFTKPWDGDELRSSLRSLLKVDRQVGGGRREKIRAEERRLERELAPQQDADGAFVIEAPE